MERRNVQLRLGGQSYRVVTTATDLELKRCVSVMEERLNEVNPKGRAPHAQALFLAMLALVNELDEAKAAAASAAALARTTLSSVLERIDAALEDDGGARSDDGRHDESDGAAGGVRPDGAPAT
jgi:cell division protein ZapA